MKKNSTVHEIIQPLTAISNFAAASSLLLKEKSANSSPLSQREIANLIDWLEQISRQTVRIGDLLRQRGSLDTESSEASESQ